MELSGLPAISAPLPWQGEAWSRFNQQLNDGNLPHALVLAGMPGSGKSRLALALARLLLCRAPSGGLNCGKCHPCEMSAAGSHGDFRWLQPDEKGRAIKIDQVRELVTFMTKTASFGERKVVVLAPADAMNTNAANGLLKSLEEPSPGTFLVLVADRIHGLPATIRSRCQLIKVPAPALESSRAWLDQATGDSDESERLLELADGMPMLAEAMYQSADGEKLIAVRAACRGLVAGKLSTNQAVSMLADAPMDEALEQMARAARNSIKSLDKESLNSHRGRCLYEFLDEVGKIQRAVRGGANPNRQLLTEVLLEKLQSVLGRPLVGGSIGA